MNSPPVSDVLAKDAAEFWTLLDTSLADGSCLGTTLSKRRPGAEHNSVKLVIRPTVVKGATVFQWSSRLAKRETHENLSPGQTAERIRGSQMTRALTGIGRAFADHSKSP